MGIQKYSTGEVLREDGDMPKTASANWTDKDTQELADENTKADAPQQEA